jgi:hypothetical protein
MQIRVIYNFLGDDPQILLRAIKYLKMESGDLVFAVVQRLPCGKPGPAPKERVPVWPGKESPSKGGQLQKQDPLTPNVSP